MDEVVAIFTRVWTDITSGAHAPLSFRLIIQPLIADFSRSAPGCKMRGPAGPLFFWAVVMSDPAHRRELLQEGWKHVGKVFIAAVIVDVIYQIIVRHWVYPSEALMVAAILSVLPYLVMRGLVNRILRHGHGGNGAI
ncbi:MAG: hypothetical protein R3F40_02370 [Candidatus Competibacteraceae bacterium]